MCLVKNNECSDLLIKRETFKEHNRFNDIVSVHNVTGLKTSNWLENGNFTVRENLTTHFLNLLMN